MLMAHAEWSKERERAKRYSWRTARHQKLCGHSFVRSTVQRCLWRCNFAGLAPGGCSSRGRHDQAGSPLAQALPRGSRVVDRVGDEPGRLHARPARRAIMAVRDVDLRKRSLGGCTRRRRGRFHESSGSWILGSASIIGSVPISFAFFADAKSLSMKHSAQSRDLC